MHDACDAVEEGLGDICVEELSEQWDIFLAFITMLTPQEICELLFLC